MKLLQSINCLMLFSQNQNQIIYSVFLWKWFINSLVLKKDSNNRITVMAVRCVKIWLESLFQINNL